MSRIDCAVITITPVGFEITATAENGAVIKESYLRGPKGYECIGGNFEDEGLLGDNDILASALRDMVEPAAELATALRTQ